MRKSTPWGQADGAEEQEGQSMYKKGMNLLNEIAAHEIGPDKIIDAVIKTASRKGGGKLRAIKRLAKKKGIGLGAALKEYNETHKI